MIRAGALATGLLVTIATPATWPLALAAFLLRGGILLVALPIVVLPTPVGLGNVLAPTLSSIAFGTIPIELVILAGSIALAAMAWLVAGGWLAAALEAEGVRIVAADEELAQVRQAGPDEGPSSDPETGVREPDPAVGGVASRILAARLIAYLPLAVVLALGSVRLVFVTYRELTSPLDVATPIVLRVLLASPEVVIGVVVAWMMGEIVGALAARRIALGDAGVWGALRGAISTFLRHPLSTLARFWLPTLGLILVAAPSSLAATSSWGAAGSILGNGANPLPILVAVIVFVALWIVGLLLLSVACAWRAAVWTVAEVAREGTLGGSSDRGPGQLRPDHTSASP